MYLETWVVPISGLKDFFQHPTSLYASSKASRASNEGGRGHVGHGLGQHRLPRARRAIEQHTAGRVDADLRVEFLVRQRQLHLGRWRLWCAGTGIHQNIAMTHKKRDGTGGGLLQTVSRNRNIVQGARQGLGTKTFQEMDGANSETLRPAP